MSGSNAADADRYRHFHASGGVIDLSDRAQLLLTGPDRVRYLNGQVTSDVRKLQTGQTQMACVTTAKGKLCADIVITAHEDVLFVDAEGSLRETLLARLERYIVADDVELTDVTEEWQLWHVWGGADAPARMDNVHCAQDCPHHSLRSSRFGTPGLDIWLPASADAPTFESLPILSEADLETWRILQKIPRWPHELNTETFPPEAGLEARAMNFTKGCYIGQEVLSRIKTTGKMPREMIAFESDVAVNEGDELWIEKALGKVTSVTKHPTTGQTIGLAMIRQGTPHQGLRVGGSSGAILYHF